MRVLVLLRVIYLGVKQVGTGILGAQQVLQDHEVIVHVCRHHALRRALDKDAKVVEGTKVGE